MALFRRRKGPFAHELDDFHAPAKPQPVMPKLVMGTSEAAKEGRRTSDLTIAALGVTLGLICALFPGYIFFNPEKFGLPAVEFAGNSEPVTGPVTLGPLPDRVGAPVDADEVPTMDLDLFMTGTLADKEQADDEAPPPGLDQQPFPTEIPQFRLVHVANGRAMIADDAGMWIVQPGSILPDSSRVAAIEKRNGKWVLVTSSDRVFEMTP